VSAERRIAEAMMTLVIERGYEAVTVAAVCTAAGIDRATFERHFGDLEDCYLRVFEANSERFDTAVIGAFQSEETWRDGLRAAAYAAARFIDANPREVRFGAIAMFQAGPMAQVIRERQLHGMVDLIDAGRRQLDDPDSLGRGVAEAVLGSIYQTLVAEIQQGTKASAEAFVPELMYIAVRPYLGHEAAVEELSRPPPAEPRPGS
jgi:AcrR family transcriptional regulator